MCEISLPLGGSNMRNATFIILASLITLMSGAARAAPDPT